MKVDRDYPVDPLLKELVDTDGEEPGERLLHSFDALRNDQSLERTLQ